MAPGGSQSHSNQPTLLRSLLAGQLSTRLPLFLGPRFFDSLLEVARAPHSAHLHRRARVERARHRATRALRQSDSPGLVRRSRSARIQQMLLDLSDPFGAVQRAEVHGRVLVTNLVTWKKHDRVLDMIDVPWACRAQWAPSIVEKDG